MYRRVSLPAACAAAFAFAALSSSPLSADAFKGGSINTYPAWDGVSEITSFGCPDTTTYGQTITIPSGVSFINKFSFELQNLDSGSMVVRAEVYAWDGSKASGSALYESRPRTLSYADGVFHKVIFRNVLVPVTTGSQYVLFLSIDKDFEQCMDNYEMGWGYVADTTYPGGTFVYQNNGGDESLWTTQAWNTIGLDSAFRVSLKP